ncbi:diguanylate cyclase [Duganella sp. FT134W]|uniref:Diguanylate cyclase n=1 Tax=Duganella margarita TaxID=2692170 RepID=A0A7X4KF13_9BURK|nr:GGDEF domain-containing protein [Duganella margarita]MYM71916.1 diguanylate cyclase [Duganella margarita]
MNLAICSRPAVNLPRAKASAVASYDNVTTLPTRTPFARTLAQQLVAFWPRASTLMLIDLDGFTALNNSLGHAAGDAILRQFAQRLQRLAPPRAPLGRLGSDEFALLLPGHTDLHAAARMATQIRSVLDIPFDLPGGALSLSACIGIASCPAHGVDEASLIQCASIALRQAKQQGRDVCCFYAESMAPALKAR